MILLCVPRNVRSHSEEANTKIPTSPLSPSVSPSHAHFESDKTTNSSHDHSNFAAQNTPGTSDSSSGSLTHSGLCLSSSSRASNSQITREYPSPTLGPPASEGPALALDSSTSSPSGCPGAATPDPMVTSPDPQQATGANPSSSGLTSAGSDISSRHPESLNLSLGSTNTLDNCEKNTPDVSHFDQETFREPDFIQSRKDFYLDKELDTKELDRLHLQNAGLASHGPNYSTHDSNPYSSYDSHSGPRPYQQNSPNPNLVGGSSHQYPHPNTPRQQSPPRLSNNISDNNLNSPASLMQGHRNSPYMHRGSPHLSDSSQHLHPHGSPHIHQDSSHFHHHHQNSPQLPLNPLGYSSGRSIDSPHHLGSPQRKDGGPGVGSGFQDGRFPPEFQPSHHRSSHPHPMQQSPSPHRPYADSIKMKDSPRHPMHDSVDQLQQYHHHQQQLKQHQSTAHEGYWNMHHDVLRSAAFITSHIQSLVAANSSCPQLVCFVHLLDAILDGSII